MGLGTAATIGLISSGTQAGMSFAQARKQDGLVKAASLAADEAMNEARKKLDVNYMEETSIATQAYKLERENANIAGARATDAGMQSERGAAATAGRVLAAENSAGMNTSSRMEQTLVDRQNKIVTEDSRLRDAKVKIDLDIAAGAQGAMADAKAAQSSALMAGMEGVMSGASTVYEQSDLYKQNLGQQRSGVMASDLDTQGITDFNTLGGVDDAGAFSGGTLDLAAVGSMDDRAFKQWKKQLSPEQWDMLSNNKGYISGLK